MASQQNTGTTPDVNKDILLEGGFILVSSQEIPQEGTRDPLRRAKGSVGGGKKVAKFYNEKSPGKKGVKHSGWIGRFPPKFRKVRGDGEASVLPVSPSQANRDKTPRKEDPGHGKGG